MKTIFLPIESARREFDYKLNLARLFCSKGLNAIIGNPPFIRDELKYKNYRGIFLEKGFNPVPDYYEMLNKKGIYLYDMSDEGASEPVYSINYQPVIDTFKFIRFVFLWGEAQREDLIKRNSDEALSQKYKVIGSPAFDLSTPKYKEFHKALKPNKLPKAYILINTNFGCFQSYNIDEQINACKLISPLSLKMMRDSYDREEKQFTVFHQWLEDIIKFFPEENFVIRPHPSEIEENYQKIFGRYENVFISKEGNVNQVISSAKLVMHKDCSTAMQSYLMGIPVIALGGKSSYENYVQWPLAFSTLPDNLDEAKMLIKEILVSGKWNRKIQLKIDENAKKIIEDQFFNVGNSSRELVNFIVQDAEELIKNEMPCKITDSRLFVQKIKLFIRKFMPLHYKIPKATQETLVKTTKEMILMRLSLFEKVDPLGIEFIVKEIFPNAFQISKR